MLYTAGPPFLGLVGIEWRRVLFLLLLSIMIIIKYPFGNKSPQHTVSLFDVVLIVCSILSIGYCIIEFNDIIYRASFPVPLDIIMGTIVIIICLEISRRVLGIILPIIGILMIMYAILGDSSIIPFTFRSPGFSWTYFVSYSFGLEGIFGFIIGLIVQYIALFVLFGSLLAAMGAGSFFIDLPYALTCGMVGGPAKTVVLASCLFGSISSSATANTAATGIFTIPLMIKFGYPKEVAGAIEPAASTGGMFMPPVMGAGVFIMAEMLGVSYASIVKIALIPALIYFFSVFMIVHYYALSNPTISVVPKEERLNVWNTFKQGFYYLIPVILLLYWLLTYMSPSLAIYLTLISILLITLIADLIKKKINPL